MPGKFQLCERSCGREKKPKRESLGLREVHLIEQSASLAAGTGGLCRFHFWGKKGNGQIFPTGILTQETANT